MHSLKAHQTSTEQWHALVVEAASATEHQLDEELESYLVFLLMRFTTRPDLATSILALEYLESCQQSGQARREQLQEVGDKCLLFSGLFPQRAQRRRVRVSYFVDLGQGAYQQLAASLESRTAAMYHHLASAFVSLMDVLQAMGRSRDVHRAGDVLQAFELWRDTGSRQALRTLRAQGVFPMPGVDDDRT